jgi:hypothetical protein
LRSRSIRIFGDLSLWTHLTSTRRSLELLPISICQYLPTSRRFPLGVSLRFFDAPTCHTCHIYELTATACLNPLHVHNHTIAEFQLNIINPLLPRAFSPPLFFDQFRWPVAASALALVTPLLLTYTHHGNNLSEGNRAFGSEITENREVA